MGCVLRTAPGELVRLRLAALGLETAVNPLFTSLAALFVLLALFDE